MSVAGRLFGTRQKRYNKSPSQTKPNSFRDLPCTNNNWKYKQK